ncbi:hypothetical protein AAHA92_22859 [Salvia divinorum]|uniref:Uncharacterized protein n=1 Tax=Salvia divinorum TaxID=28513 RepID=A0ABD1GT38_SALDI
MALFIHSPGISLLAESGRSRKITPATRRRNVNFSVRSGVRDLEKKDASKLYEDCLWWLYGQVKQEETVSFSVSETKDEEGRKQDYYVNAGYAIRTIREEFPELFYRELSFDIYRDDIVFKDPLNTFSGIENYKSIFWALRLNGRIFFKALWVDIISVWQPVENLIMVRWTVHGIPRVPWESHSRFDGTSEYKLDKDGKIYKHKVHNIALNGPQKFQVIGVEQLIQSIGCPSTPKPTYFKLLSPSPPLNIVPLMKLSAVKWYLASLLTRLKSEVKS